MTYDLEVQDSIISAISIFLNPIMIKIVEIFSVLREALVIKTFAVLSPCARWIVVR